MTSSANWCNRPDALRRSARIAPLGPATNIPTVAGRTTLVVVLGELVQTTAGTWITHPPTRCPNGHLFGPGAVLVGHVACLGHGGGGHTIWHLPKLRRDGYGPPLAKHCTALEGPASVRITNREQA